MKPSVMGDKGGYVRRSSKGNAKKFFWKNLTIRNLIQRPE